MVEPEERTVSGQAVGLVGATPTLHATLGIGALLSTGLVEDINDVQKSAEELQPIKVSTHNLS